MEFLSGTAVITVVIVAIIIVAILLGVRSVPQGFEFTVERFGRYRATLYPGLNVIIPFVDSIGSRMNVMEQVLEVPSQEVITRDNAMITVDGVAFFQILDAAKAAYEVSGLDNAILNLTMTNIRTVMGSMDLDELLSKRDEINIRLMNVVNEATAPWGVKITRIEIKDITPPLDLVNAMAQQMKAEREKRAAILDAEGQKASDILRADGEKQAVILAAEGQKEAAFREAEARERQAEAEANATRVLSQALAEGNSQAINYYVAQNYVKALEEFARSPNQKTLFMPLETSAIIGSVGGIAELISDAFGKPSGPQGGTSGPGGGTGAGPAPGPGSAQGGTPNLLNQPNAPAMRGGPPAGNNSPFAQAAQRPVSGTAQPAQAGSVPQAKIAAAKPPLAGGHQLGGAGAGGPDAAKKPPQ